MADHPTKSQHDDLKKEINSLRKDVKKLRADLDKALKEKDKTREQLVLFFKRIRAALNIQF